MFSKLELDIYQLDRSFHIFTNFKCFYYNINTLCAVCSQHSCRKYNIAMTSILRVAIRNKENEEGWPWPF